MNATVKTEQLFKRAEKYFREIVSSCEEDHMVSPEVMLQFVVIASMAIKFVGTVPDTEKDPVLRFAMVKCLEDSITQMRRTLTEIEQENNRRL